ncbi:hypothetical protein J6590_061089 [Homalodisca vitripennis]|nr:hypothetical protein J6590_061086 [Homalodisca vitripennis]KAG8266949.1 hypothetical protein J6590_061089 [Homalodisca vitripennis]
MKSCGVSPTSRRDARPNLIPRRYLLISTTSHVCSVQTTMELALMTSRLNRPQDCVGSPATRFHTNHALTNSEIFGKLQAPDPVRQLRVLGYPRLRELLASRTSTPDSY